MIITNNPPKGTADWFPEEYAVRKYIFDTWRQVCEKFGYQEYLTPLVELADVYRAKSGEDVGGTELTIFEDRGGRELAIRPEMTPSVTRMVSRNYESMPKPIRLFSIANFFRNEKPQRGRNREFWQLNFDIFGSESLNADVEVIQMGIEIMKAFGATNEQFEMLINDRELIEAIVTQILKIPIENASGAIRTLDKYAKLSREDLIKQLQQLGAEPSDWDQFFAFMEKEEQAMQDYYQNELAGNPGLDRMMQAWELLKQRGYEGYYTFSPSMVRGFDYYDGLVFEVFDKHPDNKRALFGGGRYNGLAGIFGKNSFPAVGCAPGDETLKLFLEAWELIPKDVQTKPTVFIPLLLDSALESQQKLAAEFREQGERVEVGLDVQKLGKALDYADKTGIAKVVIVGEQELEKGEYSLKDMQSGEQSTRSL